MNRQPPADDGSSDTASEPCDLAGIVMRARTAFAGGASLAVRRRRLETLRGLLRTNADAVAAALHADLGKSEREARFTEIDVVLGEIAHTLRHLKSWTASRRAPLPLAFAGARARVVREPRGVVLVLAPWNYPLQLLLAPAVGALAAGNTVVLKPSEHAPHTAALLARLIAHAFPDGALQVVTGEVDRTIALLEERFDHIVFTGSGAVGSQVMAAAAKHLTPVTLELGGKSPAWFDDDEHIDDAARRIAWAKFTNAGQTCVAPDYVMTTPERVPALAAALQGAIVDLWGEDPRASPEYGRIVNTRQFDRLAALLPRDGSSVCRIATGGQTDRDDLYIAPTIVQLPHVEEPTVGPDAVHPLLREEIFGPILPILPVASARAAITVVRGWEKPLALYVFSDSPATRTLFERETSSGAVVHDAAMIQVGAHTLPFGGVGASGMGRYHGRYSIETFSHLKPVLRSPYWPDVLRLVQPGAPTWLRQLASLLQRG